MAWVDFILCLFLGMFGVHKFKEKKIGMGILYLCTCGLLGIGWIYDSVRYFLAALRSMGIKPNGPAAASVKTIWLWVLAVFFLVLAVACLPAFAGFLALAVAALAAPIKKWQTLLSKYIKDKAKTIAIVALAVLSIGTAPASESPQPDTAADTIVVETEKAYETEATIVPTTEATTAPTTEPATVPATVPSTEPATEPATISVTTPETQPVTEPATEPVTEPTAPPPTQPPTEASSQIEDTGSDYVLNANTKKFHYPWCSSAKRIKASNRRDFHGTRDQVTGMGYVACKQCTP